MLIPYDPPHFELMINVSGKPIPKQSFRFARTKLGKWMKWIDPKVTAYTNLVRMEAVESMAGRPPLVGPVEMIVDFCFPWPKSMSRKERTWLELFTLPFRAKIPDLDNLEKNLLDGLKGIAFLDDAQVCKVTKVKIYDAEPGIRALIKPAH